MKRQVPSLQPLILGGLTLPFPNSSTCHPVSLLTSRHDLQAAGLGRDWNQEQSLDRPWGWRDPGWYEEREAQRLRGQGKGVDSLLPKLLKWVEDKRKPKWRAWSPRAAEGFCWPETARRAHPPAEERVSRLALLLRDRRQRWRRGRARRACAVLLQEAGPSHRFRPQASHNPQLFPPHSAPVRPPEGNGRGRGWDSARRPPAPGG